MKGLLRCMSSKRPPPPPGYARCGRKRCKRFVPKAGTAAAAARRNHRHPEDDDGGVWPGSAFCRRHACRRCGDEAIPKTCHCRAHKCRAAYCKEGAVRAASHLYCKYHTCQLCAGLRAANSDYCPGHKCEAAGCASARLGGRDGGGCRLCSRHKCAIPSCLSSRVVYSEYCAGHNDKAGPARGSGNNSRAACAAYLETGERCEHVAAARRLYCVLHSCQASPGCTAAKGTYNVACDSHLCRHTKLCEDSECDFFGRRDCPANSLCGNAVEVAAGGGGQACREHLCWVRGCWTPACAAGYFCAPHTCGVDGCGEPQSFSCRSIHCQQHKCSLHKCPEPRWGGRSGCQRHSCSWADDVEGECGDIRTRKSSYCHRHELWANHLFETQRQEAENERARLERDTARIQQQQYRQQQQYQQYQQQQQQQQYECSQYPQSQYQQPSYQQQPSAAGPYNISFSRF